MADVDFDDFDGAHHGGWQGVAAGQGGLSRIVHLAGAACSIALVVGLGWWGYKLAVRDVTGIPVVRALEGPMRVAPENPGGTIADHQGLAVNSVAAIGTAAPPPDRLVLAPRPVELTYEDTPGLAAAGTPAPQTQVIAASAAIQPPAASGPAPLVDAAVAPAPQDQNTGPDPDAVAQALAEALAAPLDDSTAEAMEASAEPAGTLSQRPRARPSSLAGGAPAPAAVETVSLADPASSTPVALSEVDPAMIPAGTRLVQLGAFDSADQARAEWVKLANVFGPVLDGKALVVQAAESGGRTFFRLRAHGFADEAEARGFCTTLLEQNTSCIPVEHR
jgi:hypothetical protein